jgi:hypothetical protein
MSVNWYVVLNLSKHFVVLSTDFPANWPPLDLDALIAESSTELVFLATIGATSLL